MNEQQQKAISQLSRVWISRGKKEKYLWGYTASVIGNSAKRVADGLNTIGEFKNVITEAIKNTSGMTINSYYESVLKEITDIIKIDERCTPSGQISILRM